jgi:hypothetical protein
MPLAVKGKFLAESAGTVTVTECTNRSHEENDDGRAGSTYLRAATRLLIDQILTPASNGEVVKATLSSEIDGGDLSGFDPRSEAGPGGISVSFASAIVHASKAAPL